MPNCLIVDIAKADNFEQKVIQTIRLYTACSSGIKVGTSIGGLEIVGFT